MSHQLILADPPWDFKTWSAKGKGRSAEKHYTITSLSELSRLDVTSVAAADSVLLMWATSPNMKDAFWLMERWGFTYKTVAAVWLKLNKSSNGVVFRYQDLFMGLGYYTRANAEFVLLGTRGNGLPRVDKGVRQVILAPRGAHSEKPRELHHRAERLFGDVTRLEMFARYRVPGWDAWGDEVESSVEIQMRGVLSGD